MNNNEGPLVVFPRVTSEIVKPFDFGFENPVKGGEVVEIRATGFWSEFNFPVSIHMTVYPGCEVLPPLGDHLKVTVERCPVGEGPYAITVIG